MNLENEKSVMIIDEELPLGIIANTAAILGITLGKKRPDIVGCDVTDQNGNAHLGIIAFPIPGNKDSIREIRQRLYTSDFNDMTVVDFSDLAQGCNDYDAFINLMADSPEADLQYMGVAICGPKKKVNKLTGSMPLLK